MMKRFFALLITLVLLLSCACAEEAAETDHSQDPEAVMQHSAVIQGQDVEYTTTTGFMTVETANGACEMFYMAYTLNGVEDLSQRPVTFAFNGGPGSSSEWLHMGFLSPKRIDVDENGQAASFPVAVVNNEYSILDLTDLVFIDPVGTGYSVPAEGVDLDAFMGYDKDVSSVGAFIRQYASRNGRWLSPKYLAGESYGTTRAVGLAKYLSDTYSMDLNGIILISCIHNFTVQMDAGTPGDLAYALYLPTYTADAWYHKKLDERYQQMPLEELLKEARAFAGGEYLSALFKGRSLGDEERDAVAAKMAALSGMDKEQVLKADLRVQYPDFCQMLLADQKLVIGRIDGRYTGPAVGGSMADGVSDPSNMALAGIFGAAINQYIKEELGYHTDRLYEPLSLDVNGRWSFPDDFGSGFTQEDIIREIMSKNKFLKIWVQCGYYDLATPFFATEWGFNHVFINQDAEERLKFSHYQSGHMFYMHEPSLKQFREEAEKWYRGE